MHFGIRLADEGQRPGNKPAQGNALGHGTDKNPALKGRDNVCRPFRAGWFVCRGSQGFALGWLVCAPLVLLPDQGCEPRSFAEFGDVQRVTHHE